MYFVLCRLYPSFPQPNSSVWLLPVISLRSTNTVSRVRACLSIWLERFRGRWTAFVLASTNGANVFCFLSSLPFLPPATTAVFGPYMPFLYTVSPVRACLSIWWRGFVGAKETTTTTWAVFNPLWPLLSLMERSRYNPPPPTPRATGLPPSSVCGGCMGPLASPSCFVCLHPYAPLSPF